MPDIKTLQTGAAPYQRVDPDGYREWIRDNKQRRRESKLMSARDAVARFVEDGDYLVYDCNYIMRGPNVLLREVIRQKRRDLWVGGKFTYVDVSILAAAGAISRVDCAFFYPSPSIQRMIADGSFVVHEYSNIVYTVRLQAGAEGVPFMPVRSFGGTTGFEYSGARLIEDPFTGNPVTVVPALNPDVAIIHVNQADEFGNSRVFGTAIAHEECALASRKVILSAEEIVSTDEIRRKPGLTSIPHLAVDAVVHAPFGAFPGTCAGYYAPHTSGIEEVFAAMRQDTMAAYLDKWVYSHESDEDMMRKLVSRAELDEMVEREPAKEAYRP